MFDKDSGSAVRALVMHFTRQRSELLARALFDGEQSASPTGESERAPGNVGKTPQNQQNVSNEEFCAQKASNSYSMCCTQFALSVEHIHLERSESYGTEKEKTWY